MRLLRSIFLIINYKTFIVTILAVTSTILCQHFELRANFPLTIIGIAIVFPVVFSIDSAYKRRERILMLLSDFKAHSYAIFLAARDWVEDEDLRHHIKKALITLFATTREYCTSNKHAHDQIEKDIYASISRLSEMVTQFRALQLNGGEISRINQYVSKLALNVENIKVIKQYRTPITLRAYSRVFIFSFPILFGPYFAYTAQEYSHGLEYFMPIIFSFILVSLDNIQEHLENPFDQIGEDDVTFDVEDFANHLQ